ncbi:MAG: FAD:protein FMN transferase [Magnetococcales bacterium]|nr:FAD:protein FMN transferase [Magnetococcales bacterium]
MDDFSPKKWVPLILILGFFSFWLLVKQPAQQEVHATTRLAMGTLVSVSTWGVAGGEEEKAINDVFTKISQVEALASRQNSTTPVHEINQSPGMKPFPVSEELATIVGAGLNMHTVSNGAFDPGLAHLLDLWGFAHGVPDVGRIPEAGAITAWLEERGKYSEYGIRLTKDKDGTALLTVESHAFALDLGAIAKGYALDKAMETIKHDGIANALIIGGGDMVISGSKGGKPWRIGIQHPRDREKVMAFAEISGEIAMATSGDYERFFMVAGERQHHILDPKTGRPSRSGLISVSIQTKKAMDADMFSTAVFVMGMEKGKAFIEKTDGVEGMMVAEDGSRWKSSGFKGQWLEGP